MEEKDITDYNPIRITYPQSYSNRDFDGLKKMTSWYKNYFWASPYSWYFGIGYGYSTSTTFEGVYGKPWVSHLEVYLLAGMIFC